MASGKVHARSTSTVLVVATAVIVATFAPPHVAAFIAGLIVGHYATPDVRDQHQAINEGERMVWQHFGKAAGRLWTVIWWIPARVIPHRSWLSHLPGPATILAAAWLYAVPLAALWWYSPTWFMAVWALKWWHIVGWMIQDTVHLAQDGWRWKW